MQILFANSAKRQWIASVPISEINLGLSSLSHTPSHIASNNKRSFLSVAEAPSSAATARTDLTGNDDGSIQSTHTMRTELTQAQSQISLLSSRFDEMSQLLLRNDLRMQEADKARIISDEKLEDARRE